MFKRIVSCMLFLPVLLLLIFVKISIWIYARARRLFSFLAVLLIVATVITYEDWKQVCLLLMLEVVSFLFLAFGYLLESHIRYFLQTLKNHITT